MRRLPMSWSALLVMLAAGTGGCNDEDVLPVSFLVGLRVIAIQADPPEVPAGGATTATITAVDTTGATPTIDWARCLRAPLPGQAVNPDCVTNTTASFLEPIGQGTTIMTTMPANASAETLGAADSNGGVYLPLIARATTPADERIADYRLRLQTDPAQPPNQNPTIAAVVRLGPGGVPTPLDEATPLVVHAGELLTLSTVFAPGSAQIYELSLFGQPPQTVMEVLTTSWFTTGGQLSNEKTNDNQPTTELRLDVRLPASPARIDIYAVGRDERGGTAVAHRALELE